MKRAILCAALLFILTVPTAAQAQEQPPLAMRITFEWTTAGGLLGAFVGFALWLTDPGNPNLQLSQQMAQGASLGLMGGAGYSVYILQRSAQLPIQPLVYDPLAPENRITSDPVATRDSAGLPLLAGTGAAALAGGGGFSLPMFRIRF